MIGRILPGNNIDVLKQFDDNYFSSVVTDSPYGLGKEPDAVQVLKDWLEHGYHEIDSSGGFMGKEWDSFVPQPAFWKEVYRVLKPGGHVVSLFGTRTYDWGVLAKRLAGFEIRDQLQWLYGQGFPKSHNVSKALDKMVGAEREVVSVVETKSGGMANVNKVNKEQGFRPNNYNEHGNVFKQTLPATNEAKKWDGWGTALKPANEPIVLARKPIKGTIAENIIKWGVGGLNIDACRIPIDEKTDDKRLGGKGMWSSEKMAKNVYEGGYAGNIVGSSLKGRFPANLILDEESAKLLDQQSGDLKSGGLNIRKTNHTFLEHVGSGIPGDEEISYGDSGGASRFFKVVDGDDNRFRYISKASVAERNLGLEGKEFKREVGHNRFDTCGTCGGFILQNPDRPSACKCEDPIRQHNVVKGNHHPTVKPVDLMQWLVRLVTPKNGIVLDPFAGSGTTGCACEMEEIQYVLIDMDQEYIAMSEARCKYWNKRYYDLHKKQPTLFQSFMKSGDEQK